MPQICGGVRRAEEGAPACAESEAESVTAMPQLAILAGASAAGRFDLQGSARDLLEAGDQFVDGLVNRYLLAHHAVHRLGPDVLVIEDGELVVLGEVERQCAAGELAIDRLAVTVGLPERALLARHGYGEPAAERALDIGAEVFLLHQKLDELLGLCLVLRVGEDQAGLDV